MLSAPVPHSCTFPATDPTKGFRATTTGSNAALGVLSVAGSVAESARVERKLRTEAPNRSSAACTSNGDGPCAWVFGTVASSVILDRQDDKVVRSVVGLDVVDVVDVLIRSQSSTQHALHDVTVFENVAAGDADGDVPVAADEPAAAPVGVVLAGSSACWVAAGAGAEPVVASRES
jgi:hypothetical protein